MMADRKGKSELKPRLSQTSRKAGKEPGLESDQSLIPRLATGSHYRTRPSSTRNLDQKIEEAEKQIVEEKLDSAGKYRAVKLELRNEEIYSEDWESQTLRNETKMVDRKQMIVPGSQDVPKFSSGDPKSYEDLSGRLRIYGKNVA